MHDAAPGVLAGAQVVLGQGPVTVVGSGPPIDFGPTDDWDLPEVDPPSSFPRLLAGGGDPADSWRA